MTCVGTNVLYFSGTNNDTDILEVQWNNLGTLRFEEVFPGKNIKDISLLECWIEISKLRNATGKQMFKELSNFALRVLTLPVSNAVVERVFSVMNTTKTKLRNRMSMNMLVALIRIKLHCRVKKICCVNFTPTKDMLNLFNDSMYDYDCKTQTVASTNDMTDDMFETVTLFNADDLSID